MIFPLFLNTARKHKDVNSKNHKWRCGLWLQYIKKIPVYFGLTALSRRHRSPRQPMPKPFGRLLSSWHRNTLGRHGWQYIHIYIYIYIFGLFRVFRPEGDGTGHTRPAGGRVAGQPPPLPPLRGQAPDRPAGAELLAVVPGVAQPGAPAGSLGPAGRGRGPLPQLGVDRRGPSHSSGELGYI